MAISRDDSQRANRPPGRAILLGLSVLALLAAMWAGLVRMGWALPPLRPTLPLAHGPLMVSAFLGTLIGVERAVALRRRWPYSGPLLTALGGLAAMVGVPGAFGPLLMTLGSLGLVAVFVVIVRQHPAPYTVVMALGAVAWLVGNGLWLLARPIPDAVLWWAGFLVLTIVGERLELARILRPSRGAEAAFLAASGLFIAGLIVSLPDFASGVRLAGAGMIALALWLLRYDVARHTIQQRGLTRFIAACLLSGHVWLGVSGTLGVILGGVRAGTQYDALLHSLFLGFVFAMIFGHAPLIFPAVLNLPMAYRPTAYVPLVLLHLSLLLRLAGDLLPWLAGRQWGGLINVIALLLFLANMAYLIGQGQREAA